MPSLEPLSLLTLFVVAFVAGAGWPLDCWIVSTLLGALRRGA
jgi:hypothetical protein